MAWSIGHHPPKEPELLDEFLLSLGRALYLATMFEHKCRYIVRLAQLQNNINTGEQFDAALEIVNALKDPVLKHAITQIAEFFTLDEAAVAALDRAREARNTLAHEIAAMGPTFAIRAGTLRDRTGLLEAAVQDLVAGDNVVSAMGYEIEEKERAPRSIVEAYPHRVSAWVFQGVYDST